MGTYGLEGVMLAWREGRLTAEQAVGQILQLLHALDQRMGELEAVQRLSRRLWPKLQELEDRVKALEGSSDPPRPLLKRLGRKRPPRP